MLRLKFERKRKGWNQTALAYHAKISVSDVSRIETGRFRPYDNQLKKLSRVLGVSAAELMKEVRQAASEAA